ncbi:MAG: hypothetical protein ACRDAQ_09150 [Cetobacterium sp.]
MLKVKTINQFKIATWIEEQKFNLDCFTVEFTDANTITLTDRANDAMQIYMENKEIKYRYL